MRRVNSLCALLIIFTLNNGYFTVISPSIIQSGIINQTIVGHEIYITPMEALDLVKARYAANFEKIYYEERNEYYYKLAIADYYLVYEGKGDNENEYIMHLYEFVIDEPDTGIGHTVTYGWYTVNRVSKEIEDKDAKLLEE